MYNLCSTHLSTILTTPNIIPDIRQTWIVFFLFPFKLKYSNGLSNTFLHNNSDKPFKLYCKILRIIVSPRTKKLYQMRKGNAQMTHIQNWKMQHATYFLHWTISRDHNLHLFLFFFFSLPPPPPPPLTAMIKTSKKSSNDSHSKEFSQCVWVNVCTTYSKLPSQNLQMSPLL